MKNLNKWLWVTYPALTGMFILGSAGYLFGSSSQVWDSINRTQEKVAADQQIQAKLSQKLTALRSVDPNKLTTDLEFLLQALPRNKQLLTLLSQLQTAGQEAGATMSGYQGSTGDLLVAPGELVLTATFKVKTLNQLQKVLFSLEHARPLVRVRDVKFNAGQAEIIAESLWTQLEKSSGDPAEALPESKITVDSLRGILKEYSLPEPN